MSRIVVGIDASDGAARALRWALDEARLRGAHLELVHAVPRPDVVALPAVLDLPDHDAVVAEGRRVLEHAQAGVTTDGVEVRHDVAVGAPAAHLCARASDADLLVVGARGLGGFRGLLLGSVTQQVVSHAPCPVVVVTDEGRRGGAG